MMEEQLSIQTTSEVVVQPKQQATQSSVYFYRYPVGFILLGFYFLIFGIVELVTNYSLTSYSTQLQCQEKSCSGLTGSISFASKPVFVYLYAGGLSQTDVRFGDGLDQSQMQNCGEYSDNEAMDKDTSLSNSVLEKNSQAFPCGELVYSYPEGTFTISSSGNEVAIKTDQLSILGTQYQNKEPSGQWADVEKQRFRVWAQRNVETKVRKYWGYIEETLSGNFQIQITTTNTLYQKFKQSVWVILSDNEAYSGYNTPSCIINLTAAALQFILGCISFWVRAKMRQSGSSSIQFQENQEAEMTQIAINVARKQTQ